MLDRRMLFIVYITLNSHPAIKIFDLLSGAGWVTTSNETVRMKAVNHEPMISLEGTTFPLGL